MAKPANQGSARVAVKRVLYIGLGGFGREVLDRIKSRIEEEFEERERAMYEFIALDTHEFQKNPEFPKGIDAGDYIALMPGASPDKIAKQYGDVLWWYEELAGSWYAPRIQGANGVRVVGRIAFLNPNIFSEDIVTAIQNKWNAIRAFQPDVKTGAAPGASTAVVYVISSLAGGTGSGMLLDVLGVLKEALGEDEAPDIRVVTVTPQAWMHEIVDTYMRERVLANSYATLKELFYFYKRGKDARVKWAYPYPSGYQPTWKEFTVEYLPLYTYILDVENQNKVIARTRSELADLVAEFLMLEISTVPGAGGVQLFDFENFAQVGMQGVQSFASFGLVRFGIPVEELHQYYVSKIVHSALEMELEEHRKEVEDRVNLWIQKSSLRESNADELQNRLIGTIQINPKLENLGGVKEWPANVRIKAQEMEGKILKVIQVIQSKDEPKKDDQIQKLIDQQRQIVQTAIENFKKMSAELLENFSVGAAYRFAKRAHEALKHEKNALESELKGAKDKVESARKRFNEALKMLDATTKGFWFFRKGQAEDALDSVQKEWSHLLPAIRREVVIQVGIDIYDQLLETIEKEVQKLEKAMNRLKDRYQPWVKTQRDYFDIRLRNLADPGHPLRGNYLSIFPIRLADQFFNEQKFSEAYVPGVRKRLKGTAEDARENAEPPIFRDLSEEEWFTHVSGELKELLRNRLEELTVRNVLERFYDSDKREMLVRDVLFPLAQPLFPTSQNKKGAERQVMALATNEDNYNYLKAYIQSADPRGAVPNHLVLPLAHEVVLLSMAFGYRLDAYVRIQQLFNSYQKLQKAYEQARDAKRSEPPVHAWSGAEVWDEPAFPPEYDEAIPLFAVALAFAEGLRKSGREEDAKRLIYTRSNYYYMHHRMVETALGQGLEQALRTFQSRRDLQNQVRRTVEELMIRHNLYEICGWLRDYFNHLNTKMGTYASVRRAHSRGYVEALKSLAQAICAYLKDLDCQGVPSDCY